MFIRFVGEYKVVGWIGGVSNLVFNLVFGGSWVYVVYYIWVVFLFIYY